MLRDVRKVLTKLDEMRARGVWPNGKRHLWTDAFGVVLLASLHDELGDRRFVDEARWVTGEVDRVLGRKLGYAIGEDQDGQHFHDLAMWAFALTRLGAAFPDHRARAIELVRDVHERFVDPEMGVLFKMTEDLSAPYPGFGLGPLNAFQGYVVYRLVDPKALAAEIEDMERLVRRSFRSIMIAQDLALGMMLWATHFFPTEDWAVLQRRRSLDALGRLWIDPPGYFCRSPFERNEALAYANYGISVGLQSVGAHPDRVARLNRYFETHLPSEPRDTRARTEVMGCASSFPGELVERPAARRRAGGAW